MKTKFDTLFEQTFISAQQKQPSVPADEINAVQPSDEPKDAAVSVVAVPGAGAGMSVPPENVPGNLEDESEENSMFKANLYSIFTDAKEIHDIVQSGFHPEAWMIQKVAVCSDNLSSVLKAVKYDAAAHSSCGEL